MKFQFTYLYFMYLHPKECEMLFSSTVRYIIINLKVSERTEETIFERITHPKRVLGMDWASTFSIIEFISPMHS